MQKKMKLAALLVLAFFSVNAISCNNMNLNEDSSAVGGSFDLNNPPKLLETRAIGEDVASGDAAEIFKTRCGMCHEYSRGLDKHKGEAWEAVIERMMKKPGSMMNAAIAGVIYVYLYEKTTGEPHPDRERLLSPPVNTAGTQEYVGGRAD